MKKIILLFLLIISIHGLCQDFPAYNFQSSQNTRHAFLGALESKKGFINGVYADTTAANSGFIDFHNGAQIWAGGYLWLRDSVGNRWLQMAKFTDIVSNTDSLFGVQDNLFTADRHVNGDNATWSMFFDELYEFEINSGLGSFVRTNPGDGSPTFIASMTRGGYNGVLYTDATTTASLSSLNANGTTGNQYVSVNSLSGVQEAQIGNHDNVAGRWIDARFNQTSSSTTTSVSNVTSWLEQWTGSATQRFTNVRETYDSTGWRAQTYRKAGANNDALYKGIRIDTSSNIVFENYPSTRNDGNTQKVLYIGNSNGDVKYGYLDTTFYATQYDLTTVAAPNWNSVMAAGANLSSDYTSAMSTNHLTFSGTAAISTSLITITNNGGGNALAVSGNGNGAALAVNYTGSTSPGLEVTSTLGGAVQIVNNVSGTNNLVHAGTTRRTTPNTAANGFGSYWAYQLEADDGIDYNTGLLVWKWTNADGPSNLRGELAFLTTNASTNDTTLTLMGTHQLRAKYYGDSVFTGTPVTYAAFDDNHNLIEVLPSSIGGGGGGTGSNLSWDAANHEVDIDGGGTSAVIPYATIATTGLINSSSQTIDGIKTFDDALQASSYIEWKSGTGSVMGVLSNRSSGADDYGSIQFYNDLNANIVHFSIVNPTATRNINLPDASGTVALTTDVPTNLTSFVSQTNWRLFYSNGSGDVTELAFGANGEFLQSTGTTSAPIWATPSGSGTINSGTTGKPAYYVGSTTLDDFAAVDYATSVTNVTMTAINNSDVTMNIIKKSGQDSALFRISSAPTGFGDLVHVDNLGRVSINNAAFGNNNDAVFIKAKNSSLFNYALMVQEAGGSPIFSVGNDDEVKIWPFRTFTVSATTTTIGSGTVTLNGGSTGLTMIEQSTPSTPSSGYARIYPKSDGLWYGIDDAGVETKLSNDAGGGANTALSNLAAVAINTSLLPATDDAIDLGSASKQWRDLYMTGASIYMAGVKTLSSAGLDLPTGGGIRTRTSAGNTVLLQAYDVDGAAYTTFATLTANNTPTLNFSTAVTVGGSSISTGGGTATGTNTGDQTSIVGITGTTAQFNTALSDNDFATLAGSETLSGKTLTAPKIANAGFIADANGNELIIFTTTGSAINEITFNNAATGNNPGFTASGGGTDIGIDFTPKAAGKFRLLATSSGPAELRLFEDSDNGTNYGGFIVPSALGGDRTYTFPDASTTIPVATQTLTYTGPSTARTITYPDANFTAARTDAAQTFTGSQSFSSAIITNTAVTASGNAATVAVTSSLTTVTNNSAATLTITLTTASAVDGQVTTVRILDATAAAQTITWVNTENSSVTAPTTSNGSTTLFLTVKFIYNNATSKWRCIGFA